MSYAEYEKALSMGNKEKRAYTSKGLCPPARER